MATLRANSTTFLEALVIGVFVTASKTHQMADEPRGSTSNRTIGRRSRGWIAPLKMDARTGSRALSGKRQDRQSSCYQNSYRSFQEIGNEIVHSAFKDFFKRYQSLIALFNFFFHLQAHLLLTASSCARLFIFLFVALIMQIFRYLILFCLPEFNFSLLISHSI